SLQKSHLDIPTARAWAYFSNEITPLHIASWVNPVFRRSAYYLAKIQPVPTLESYGELEDLLDPEWEDSLGKIEYGELDRKYIIETLAQESGWKEKDLKDDICLSDIFPYENDIGLKLFTLFPDVDQLLRFPNNATLLELINLIENRSDS
ncbi:MAG: hypothetical protein KDD56_08730, partial [Bdellovibrionales bacterium]|nr:hypothetical protein [Bdellovibrionales bacterium]